MWCAIILIITCGGQPEGDLVRGGRLWDAWWTERGAPAPSGTPPYAEQSMPAEAFRCVTCHGWAPWPLPPGSDLAHALLSPDGHDLGQHGLDEQDVRDLEAYLNGAALDPAAVLTSDGRFRGDPARGGEQFNAAVRGGVPCAACHGPEGAWLNFGTPQAPAWIGTLAAQSPERFIHAMRFGRAGSVMPSWEAMHGDTQTIADVGAFAQSSLPATPSQRAPAQWTASPPPAAIEPTRTLLMPQATSIGSAPGAQPLVAHVLPVDLDADGHEDIVVCDVQRGGVFWIQQAAPHQFEESQLGQAIAAPVHADAVDIDGDGDLDLAIASMGVMLPSTERIGRVVLLEQTSPGVFQNRTVLEGVHRVTDVRGGDLDSDGDIDLAVSQFGYVQGTVQWLEQTTPWSFRSHHLMDRSGAIHGPLADIDNDGDLDLIVLFSQEWETVQAFVNDGLGTFTPVVLHDVPDADFSSSGLIEGDVDADGDIDFVWANGDAFVSAGYRPLPTHGMQWLENTGHLQFTFHRIGQFDGAYGPMLADFDGDGDMDIAAVSEFADWEDPATSSVRWWSQEGDGQFAAQNIDTTLTHLVTAAATDLDQDGRIDIVAGGMALYPPFDRVPRVVWWRQEGTAPFVARPETSALPPPVASAVAAAPSPAARGMVLHANGFLAAAEEAYAEAEAAEPSEARWPYYRGLIALTQGDSAAAMGHLTRAASVGPTYPPLQSRLGELHAGRGDYSSAAQAWELAGDRPEVILGRARMAMSLGNQDEARRLLEGHRIPAAASLLAAIRDGDAPHRLEAVDMGLQPADPWRDALWSHAAIPAPLVVQAQIAFIAGDIKASDRLLRHAYRIAPTDRDTVVALSNLLLLPGHCTEQTTREAAMLLQQQAELLPDDPQVRSRLAWAQSLLGDPGAVRIWESIVEDHPDHAPSLLHLGQWHAQQGHSAVALSYLRRGIAVPRDSAFSGMFEGPLRATWLEIYGDAAKSEGHVDEAQAAYTQAVRLTPLSATARFKLGNLLVGRQAFADAVTHLEAACAIDPDKANARTALGYALLRSGHSQRAQTELRLATDLKPSYALAWFHLASAASASGERDEAIAAATEAVRLRPDFARARQLLQRLQSGGSP